MENENLQEQPIIQSPSFVSVPQKENNEEGIIKFVIAAFCFVLGFIQIGSSLFLGIGLVPQLVKLQSNLGGNEYNQYIIYFVPSIAFLIGCITIIAGIRAIKGKSLNKSLLFSVFSFFISVGFLAFVINSIISPIYKLTSNYQNSSAPLNQAPTPTPDPTADWKTYANTQYGFSLKYPKNWIISEGITQAGGEYKIIIDHPNDILSVLPSLYIDIWENSNSTLDPSNTKIDGVNANRSSTPTGKEVANEFTAFKMGSTLYQIVLMYNDGKVSGVEANKYDKEAVAIYNQILSTFKFTK